jgi:hypothetical protein
MTTPETVDELRATVRRMSNALALELPAAVHADVADKLARVDALLARLATIEAERDQWKATAEMGRAVLLDVPWAAYIGANVRGDKTCVPEVLAFSDRCFAFYNRIKALAPYPTDEMLEADAVLDAGGELP